MIKITHNSGKTGDTARYVARNACAGYRWCEQCLESGRDLMQGTCDADDLPANIKLAADKLHLTWPNYVSWPKDYKS